ncbi:hypothetical protein DFJ58DRAFT_846298 [Suillus subalutaceus]|uniref:uncharacterized protein n=1 Tax=Suillus subalutaceus TaxID=48586 RepID=UPI001B8616FE|nr:uncharacterized protein DFJ58DRAFT_846298 [Suillus subalutaceus]KAG1837842.1 hypothetical protein DFJ58DRAFT_846298 [Suillus subalutaceus]
MSRLSIVSSASRADRRRLPPMNRSQPNIRRLRTWVYNKEDNSCSTTELGRLILRVGETIAIFPDDPRAVPKDDGSLPIMSYWYGKVAKIYLKAQGETHVVWLEIQWYYRRLDLEDRSLAESMGEYELVLSDHTSFVDMSCMEDHAVIISYDEGDLKQCQLPPKTLYHRWNIEITFVRNRNDGRIHGVHLSNPQRESQCRCNACDNALYSPSISQRYCRKCKRWFNHECLDALECRVDRIPDAGLPAVYGDIHLEKEFLDILTMPICRGGPFGVVGNGSIYSRAKSLLREAKINGKLSDGWRDFQHWSTRNTGSLLKSKATIKDADGECSFEISGHASQSCAVAAHYRVPLRAINKKFGVYRKIVTHLTKSSHPLATQLQDTYLSVMDYMHNVRIAFCVDARGSSNPLEAGFRSPAFDYYLWLDHKAGGFHDRCRVILEQDHNITFKSIQNQEGKDIIPLHYCCEYDVCGAFQGCVSEEDLQHLLDAVDASMMAGHEDKRPSSPTTSHMIDTATRTMSVMDITDDVPPLSESVDTTVAACFNEAITVSDVASKDRNTELINTGESIEDGYPVSVLQPFPHPFDWSYCKRALRTMGVKNIRFDISRWFIAHLVVRMREIHGLGADTPLDNTVVNGSDCQVTYAEYCELHGMTMFLSKVQTIKVERQSIAQFFTSAGRGLSMLGRRVDCAVQCDAESQGASCDMFYPYADDGTKVDCGMQIEGGGPVVVAQDEGAICAIFPNQPATDQRDDYIADASPSDVRDESSAEQLYISLPITEPSFTMDVDNPCISASDWTLELMKNRGHESEIPTISNKTRRKSLSDTPRDTHAVPQTRLRSRNLKEAKSSTTLTQKRRRGNSPSQHDPMDVFAVQQLPSRKKGRPASSVIKYTIEDLIKASQMDPTSIPHTVRTSYIKIDPDANEQRRSTHLSSIQLEMILSKATSKHNTMHYSSALLARSLSDDAIPAATSLMKFEYWLKDVALECKDALEKLDMPLAPLAHHVLVELSTRASIDAASLSSALEIYISRNNCIKAVGSVIRYLCKLRLSQSGADNGYEPGFKILAMMMKARQEDTPL